MPRPSKPILSRANIAEAARQLLDATGQVSLSDLARTLGVQPSSLYNHVTGRDEIVQLAIEALIERSQREATNAIAPEAAWQEWVRWFASRSLATISEHPWLPAVFLTSATATRPVVAVDGLVQVLLAAGFTPAEVYMAVRTIGNLAMTGGLDASSPEDIYHPDYGAADTALGRAMRAVDPVSRPAVTFAFVLDALVESMEALLASRR